MKKITSSGINIISLVSAVMFTLFSAECFAQAESEFYTETIHNHTLTKNLKDDYGVDGTGNSTDSPKLQQAINEVSSAGGGSILLPEGTYQLKSIVMKSNVHILIEANSIIHPGYVAPEEKARIFTLGNSSTPASNVSIRGVGGRYIVNLPWGVKGMTVFGCGDVNNFLIADFTVNDRWSVYSAIGMSPSSFIQGRTTWPRNGVVRNGTVLDAHFGYGLVQTQAATNVLFRNIHCTGGATLRVETGWTKMNDLQIGGVDRIFGRNVSCTNGHCAVMIAPHSMHNGSVDVDTVISHSAGYAVTVGGNYVSTKYTNPDLIPGTFSDVKVRNVTATFGIKARLKSQQLKYIPVYREKYLTDISEDGGKSVIGPAISAVKFSTSPYDSVVEISNVKAYGFLCQENITDEFDEAPHMDCKTVDTMIIVPDTTVSTSASTYSYTRTSAVVTDTSIIKADTLFYPTMYTVKTLDTTITNTLSTITTVTGLITTIDTTITRVHTVYYKVDVPPANRDTIFFNMDTTIIVTARPRDTYSSADTSYTYSDSTYMTVDTSANTSYKTFLYEATGTNDLDHQSLTRVYPNPVSGNLNIEVPVENQAIRVRMVSSTGTLVLVKETRAGRISLDTRDLVPGIYLLQLESGRAIRSYKILKH